MRASGTGTIEVAIAPGRGPSQPSTDPFLSEMLSALAEELASRGYDLLVSRVRQPLEEWLPQQICAPRADGIIILGDSIPGTLLSTAARDYLPLVVWGGAIGQHGYCSVGTDDFNGARLAVEHLLSLGRRAIVFLGEVEAMPMRQRYEGYRHALESAAGTAGDPAATAPAPQSAQSSIRELLSGGRSFDALFAANDVIALEAMQVLKEAGLRVPEDVAVVGFDDIAPAALASPPLTTIRRDVREGARVLVELLLKRMAGETSGSVTLTPRLVVRESTRPHVTQHRRHESDVRLSDERFRLAFENAPIGIALIGISGRWLKVNASMCRMLGYTPEELFATNFQSLTHPDDLANDLAQVEEVLAGKITSYQMSKRYFHRSGRVVPAMLSVSLVRDREQRPQYFVSHVEDLSGRLEAERVRSEFVAVVGHELRSPLTAIHGALGLLASQALGQLPEQANAMVQIANQDCTRLARLINDILDAQKSDPGQPGIRLGPVDLAPFLRQALESNRAYAERCGVTLHLDPVSDELAVLADPDRLMQVLSNLLTNASKFSPLGRQVHVRCVPQEARVVIQVIDQGVGIPETFRPRIFGRSEQADSSQTQRFDGTGPGLNITRKLVHAMGGSINFVSEFGHGTTFFFDLPRVEIDSASAVSAA